MLHSNVIHVFIIQSRFVCYFIVHSCRAAREAGPTGFRKIDNKFQGTDEKIIKVSFHMFLCCKALVMFPTTSSMIMIIAACWRRHWYLSSKWAGSMGCSSFTVCWLPWICTTCGEHAILLENHPLTGLHLWCKPHPDPKNI